MPSHYKGAENEVRALNAFINLMRASDSLAARGALLLESQGLTHGQFGTMEALFHLGPLCQRALGAAGAAARRSAQGAGESDAEGSGTDREGFSGARRVFDGRIQRAHIAGTGNAAEALPEAWQVARRFEGRAEIERKGRCERGLKRVAGFGAR